MAVYAASSMLNPSTRVRWMWNADANPFSKSPPIEWRHYSDIENMIIEKAFISGKTHAILDDYHIDFKHKVQICNEDTHRQRPVKRVERYDNNAICREERFMSNPIIPSCPYGSLYGFISPFVKEVIKDLKLDRHQLPSKNSTIIPMIVEKAAAGIVEEGKLLGKQCEAEYLATILLEKKDAGSREVWRYCAHVYSLECFLYKKLNESMRLIGSKEHERYWRTKVRTLGPFCLLLWDNPFDDKLVSPGTILYRGVELSEDLVALLKHDLLCSPRPLRSFQAFTSCTRKCDVAEAFGNVLFVMTTRLAFTVNLKEFSAYPHEEEELLFPGVSFTIDRVEFDKYKNKHVFYLTLQQRHNKIDQNKLSNDTITANGSIGESMDNTTLIYADSDAATDIDDFLIRGRDHSLLGNDIYGVLYYFGYTSYPDRGANHALNAPALRAYYGDQYNPTRYIDAEKFQANPRMNPFLMTDYNGYHYNFDNDNGPLHRNGYDCDWD